MAAYLITGASRGLGLEFASQLAELPSVDVSIIFAATRSTPSKTLQQLIDNSNGRVAHVHMDIADKQSVAVAAGKVEKIVGGKGLDVLMNNADIVPFAMEGVAGMDLAEGLKVNLEAVHVVNAAFMGLLRKGGKKSSTLGSIAMVPQFTFAPAPAYKISKTALNILTAQYALDYGKEGFTFLLVSPGYLKTDMSGDGADLEVEVGAKATLDILARSTKDDNGKFFNIHVKGYEDVEGPNRYDGKEVPR